MKIYNHNNVNFKHLVPTEQVLKTAINIHTVDDGRVVCNSCQKITGHVGFYKTARRIITEFIDKNEFYKNIVDRLNSLPKEEQLLSIKKYAKEKEQFIDVI